MKIAVDFDGTIVTHEYPAIGEEFRLQQIHFANLLQTDINLSYGASEREKP